MSPSFSLSLRVNQLRCLPLLLPGPGSLVKAGVGCLAGGRRSAAAAAAAAACGSLRWCSARRERRGHTHSVGADLNQVGRGGGRWRRKRREQGARRERERERVSALRLNGEQTTRAHIHTHACARSRHSNSKWTNRRCFQNNVKSRETKKLLIIVWRDYFFKFN